MAKILAVASHASDDPTKATLPFITAVGAIGADKACTIALVGEAVSLVKEAVAKNIHGVGFPPLTELLAKIRDKVPVFVWGACSVARGVTEADLKPLNASFMDPIKFANLIAESNVVSFWGCGMPRCETPYKGHFRRVRLLTDRLVFARWLMVALTVLLVSVGPDRAVAQSDAELEQQNRVGDLLKLLGAQQGSMIADVGAGDGFFTVRIARAVRPSGRVVAVDISEPELKKLRERASRENASNVDAILGTADDPHLAVGQFDAALIHNAYHEMTEHDAMLRHIRAALKPGGRLLVVEPLHDASRGLPRDQQVAKHDIEPDIVNGELRAAGFDVVERDDNFIKFTGVPGGFWMMLARSK